MGGFNTHFVVDSNSQTAVGGFSHPNKPNWITAHAIATELSIAEVERLWKRFQQLGCTVDGILTEDKLRAPQLQSDAFIRNILKQFKAGDGTISFETFLRALKWAEMQDNRTKARAIYSLLNNGKPLNKDILSRIMRRVYPEDSSDDIQRVSSMFFKQMDPQGRGMINEDQFVEGVMKLPPSMLETVLAFNILPQDMRERVHRNLPEFSSRDVSRQAGFTPGNPPPTYRPTTISPQGRMTVRQVPSDAILREIAEKIHRRDWDLLANRLGFLTEDIDGFREVYADNSQLQVFTMLKDWKMREGMNARADLLETALREANMVDASLILSP
ncbi:uncharacterized protein LOC124137388 [Haliotis rufescens]|uniref:uncharacterized protein LOC124137388 n=1 Tax=Haliotis rufescens TaxID=6454 RepID=UPI001EB05191|nr:uncharacterized protein LOC124137388 [Haliotis rufescens]XP_046359619.1 uncharacterized protein LOC124137388 [Haliotis rufescens]